MTHTTKHTPGPLKAVQIIIENSPCMWAVQRKNIREQWGKPSVATYIDNEADARLFAAAPAMYEALKQTFNVVENILTDSQLDTRTLCGLTIREWTTTVRAALAQAEGGGHE